IRKKDRKLIVSDIRAHSGILKYAIDFTLPQGTPILAAQNGVIIDVVDKFNKGGDGKKYYKYLNYMTIEHKNKELSQYGHLKHNGALVKIGQKVKAGEVIGYTGNTGWTTEPHLHFHVCRDVDNKEGWETMQIRFKEKFKYLVNSKNNLTEFRNKYASK
ncbi:MAG: M23 family metallopeptidase, partial [Bacteroidetes bacterium]|nr:M23 family metallopeptidase [Bacteroidota bacterium]